MPVHSAFPLSTDLSAACFAGQRTETLAGMENARDADRLVLRRTAIADGRSDEEWPG